MIGKPLILIVDDDGNFLEILSTKLKASGFDTAVAHSGTEAFTESQKILPDLILMDILMPGVGGTDAALAIKQNPKTSDVKIAFLTSLKDPWPSVPVEYDKLSKAIGMEDFIEKTNDLDSIVNKIKEILARIR